MLRDREGHGHRGTYGSTMLKGGLLSHTARAISEMPLKSLINRITVGVVSSVILQPQTGHGM